MRERLKRHSGTGSGDTGGVEVVGDYGNGCGSAFARHVMLRCDDRYPKVLLGRGRALNGCDARREGSHFGSEAFGSGRWHASGSAERNLATAITRQKF